jgi:hypothetical protein
LGNEKIATLAATPSASQTSLDAWYERVAICLEAGDIGEDEARMVADAEIGLAFFEAFMSEELSRPGQEICRDNAKRRDVYSHHISAKS